MREAGRRRVLVLGLDGADWSVIDPLLRAGRLPHLARFIREGVRAPLASTTPAMSFPAWSSFLTGLAPGRHGLFDFTQKEPGAWRLRFTSTRDRRGASFLRRASEAGRRVLALGIPGTWPPEPVEGLVVPGFDAPVSSGSDPRASSAPALYRAIAARTGPWMTPDLEESAAREGWHEAAVEALLARVRRKTAFACEALRRLGAVDLACVVFSESDTVAHHFWRDHDPASPRHDPRAGARRRGAVAAVYEALDAACGEIRAAFGEEALCLVLSDHGSGGAARHVVHLNRRLEEVGLLRRRAGADGLARRLRDAALRALPPRAAQAVFRRTRGTAARVESVARFGGFDFVHTRALSEEANTQPGVWIALRGREVAGAVAPSDYERVRGEVIDALLDWKLPGGEPVVARALPRDDAHSGPFVERAPDVVVELGCEAGYGLSLVPTPWHARGAALRHLRSDELGGGRGRGMNGTHRPNGILLATGPGAAGFDAEARPRLVDLAPTLLAQLGVAWQEALDGAPLASPARSMGAADEAKLAARLRALGYLE